MTKPDSKNDNGVISTVVPDSMFFLNRGVALADTGDLQGAVTAFREAVRLDPTNHQAWRNLGAALKGSAPPMERITCYRRALAIEDDPITRANLSAALLDNGDNPAALIEAQAAVKALPEFISAWINLCLALAFLGKYPEAESAYRQALTKEPDNTDVLHGLGALLAAMERYEEAAGITETAEALRPDDHKIRVIAARARHMIADWNRFDADISSLKTWVAERRVGLPPFNLLSLPGVSGQEQLMNAEVHARAEFDPFFRSGPLFKKKTCSDRPVRVGYLTADLRDHVMGRLMGPVLLQNSNRHHEVFVYDLWSGANPRKPNLEPHVAAWKNISQTSILDAARLIAHDEIDILVDMSGYTGHGRSGILACRPAPIQAGFLGYPGSLGDRRLADYILTDKIASPPEHEKDYAEAFAWMPGSILPPVCFELTLPRLTRGELGLPETGIVLAAFHNAYKYNPIIFAVWMRILKALPQSVLWLLASSNAMQDRLSKAARESGCDSHRLVFYTGGTYAEYRAALSLADLFLDTQPYTAGGTARDALWCGVPMVTVTGGTFAGRMAASACYGEGVPECCAPDLDAYVDLAVSLAHDRELRNRLAGRLTLAWSDGPGRLKAYAENLDKLYQAMVERHRAGLPADHLDLEQCQTMKPITPVAINRAGSPMKTFLHIGCGPKRKDQTTQGFNTPQWQEVRLDIDASVNPDITGTMTDMSGVADGSVDAVFSSHNIEHLYPHEVPKALAEFIRVLRPQGFLIVTCPDLQSVCALVAEDKLTEAAYTAPAGPIAPLDILYGHRASMARGNLFMAHRCGFTQKVLTGTLQAHGFANTASLRRGHPYYDIWAVASKHPVDENTLRQWAMEHFPA